MKDLLIEIGTEELPASYINPAVEYIKGELAKILKREDIKTYCTPRRLAFFVKSFENKEEEKEELIVGPPLHVAYQEGKPTKALLAFLEKVGAKEEDIIQTTKGEGVYIGVKRRLKGKKPLQVLAEEFERILLSVPFPKRMRWNSTNLTFARPIRWICALYGEEVLPLSFGHIKANRITYGHRILSPNPITLEFAGDYEGVLKDNYVVPDYKERLGMVLAFVKEEAYALGGEPEYPEGLAQEVANLVEFPFAVVGEFETKYLELPPKVIITVLAHHQRFFCVKREEKLLPYFVAISNNYPRDGVIRKGYERVIRARLEDALFFYREDLKRRLEDLVPELSQVVFHPKVGSMLEKVERTKELALRMAESLGLSQEERQKLERSAHLCKADLLTHMVKELDELQGYMGYVYALRQGEEEEVAKAIYEHYLPKSSADPLPSNTISAILSVADKLDSLQSLIKAGEEPTGSSDPYGMRRLAYGLFAVIDAYGFDLDLEKLIPVDQRLEEFLKSRLESYLEPYGHDLIKAVMEVKRVLRPLEVIKGVKELAKLKTWEELKDIASLY
ncbi:MAG: glycine--tRNA ligase subunit beta, partial [Aquificota bacterium]